MKSDDKDFFEELIDDETDSFAPELADADEFGEDDDIDEDDDASELRTAVLTKNEMLALLTLKTNERGGQIVRIDPRQTLPTAQRYESAEDAADWFRRSLATSRQNGWDVVYVGRPLFG